MNQSNSLPSKQINSASLIRHLIIGGGIALTIILIFLLVAGEPDPHWPKLWMLKPFIIVPFAGVLGGWGFYFIYLFMSNKNLAVIVGLLGYVMVLWMGFVLGLNGTLWN